MRTIDVQPYQDRLLELRAQLTNRVNNLLEAVQEEVQPPGEHDHPACEGIDADMPVQQTEADILRDVEAALTRTRQGTFGVCTGCGGDIPAARLKAMPYTPVCRKCAEAR